MDTVSSPRISVLMAVHNSEQYLAEAIESIRNQTIDDFEFLIVDDCSTDQSASIIANYATLDKRIHRIHNDQNLGLAQSLNKGLKLARGQYIARMDADDISLPDRLMKQVAFLDVHPNIGICGTWVKIFGAANRYWRPPIDDPAIRSQLFFESALAHPSVMIRRQLIAQHDLQYDTSFRRAQDYALWVTATEFTSVANLPEVLLHYRHHSQQASAATRGRQVEDADQVRLRQLARLQLNCTQEEREFHLKVTLLDKALTADFVMKAEAWLKKLKAANQIVHAFPEPAFSERLSLQWFYICLSMANLSMPAWQMFRNSPLAQSNKIKFTSKVKFLLLCVFSPLRRSLWISRHNQG